MLLLLFLSPLWFIVVCLWSCCITFKRSLQTLSGRMGLSQRAAFVHHPAGCMYPGTSLVRADCSVVTGGSFEGGPDRHGDRASHPPRVQEPKGPESRPETPNRPSASPGEIRGEGGRHVDVLQHLFGVQKVTAGGRSPAAAPQISQFYCG